MTTKEEVVSDGVDAQALMDRHLTKAIKAAERYGKAIEGAINTEMFSSALEAKLMLAQARALSGKIAECAAEAARLHISGTALAVANGVDLGSVTTVGGVPFPGMSTMGGGGR